MNDQYKSTYQDLPEPISRRGFRRKSRLWVGISWTVILLSPNVIVLNYLLTMQTSVALHVVTWIVSLTIIYLFANAKDGTLWNLLIVLGIALAQLIASVNIANHTTDSFPGRVSISSRNMLGTEHGDRLLWRVD